MAAPTTLAALRTQLKTAAERALIGRWKVLAYTPDEQSSYLAWFTVTDVDYQAFAYGQTLVGVTLTMLDPARPLADSEKMRDGFIAGDSTLIKALQDVDGVEVESATTTVRSLEASVDDTGPIGVVVITMAAFLATN